MKETERGQVLIVENDEMQWAIYREYLGNMGYGSLFATNCAQALKQIEEHECRVAFLDLGLNEGPSEDEGQQLHVSDMERGELTYYALSEKALIPIIVVATFRDSFRGRQIIKRMAPKACISKPLREEDVRKALAVVLGPD